MPTNLWRWNINVIKSYPCTIGTATEAPDISLARKKQINSEPSIRKLFEKVSQNLDLIIYYEKIRKGEVSHFVLMISLLIRCTQSSRLKRLCCLRCPSGL